MARCVEFQKWKRLSQFRLWHAAVMAFHSTKCMAQLANYRKCWNCEIKWPWVKTGGAGRTKLHFCASRVPCILRKNFAEGGQWDFPCCGFFFPEFFFFYWCVLILTGSCWTAERKAKLIGVALGTNLSPGQDSWSPTPFFFLPWLWWSENLVAFPGLVGFLWSSVKKEIIVALLYQSPCGPLNIRASCRDYKSKLKQLLGWWWIYLEDWKDLHIFVTLKNSPLVVSFSLKRSVKDFRSLNFLIGFCWIIIEIEEEE